MRVPDFFIVGAPKCGTTALYEYLRTHPGIYLPPDEKEPHFFCTDLLNRNHCRYEHLPDYLRLFEQAGPLQLTGEASVFYLYSSVAIPNILRANPAARFIVLIRNPVELAYSLHAQLLRLLQEDVADFESAWHLQGERRRGRRIPETCDEPALLQYRLVCGLTTQLARLFRLAPEEQRLVLVFDDLKRNPRATYLRTLAFLGLPDDGRSSFERVNPSSVLRSAQVAKLLHSARARLGKAYTPIRKGFHRLGLRPYRWFYRVNAKPTLREPLRPEFRAELEEEFRGEIRALEDLLQRSFHWISSPARPLMKAPVSR